MAISVERFSEGSGWMPPWVRHQHTARYEWACTLIDGCRVIDAACGTGYGSKMMLEHGALCVDGFDVSPEAVEGARAEHGGRDRLRFAVADAARLPVADHSYDVYVSFETIEHVVDDHALVAEAARVLKPGGKFICSTPNRDLLDPGTSIRDRPFNEFHVREYAIAEFETLLAAHFRHVKCLGQSFYDRRYEEALGAVGRRLPGLAVKLHQVRKLCGVPWENHQRHLPSEITHGRVPEILIAVLT